MKRITLKPKVYVDLYKIEYTHLYVFNNGGRLAITSASSLMFSCAHDVANRVSVLYTHGPLHDIGFSLNRLL